MSREFDIALFGASGFTGKLVADYIAQRQKTDPPRRLVLAGRDLAKLAAVRDEAGLPEDTPLVRADSDDPAALADLALRSRVVLTTVGPYQLYGSALVAACAEAATHYVDLCGEVAWMRAMIDAHEATAKASGARIVFSCGFDSIPFDLGVLFLQEGARARFGAPCPRVKTRVRKMKGESSGGTVASFKATMAAAGRDPAVMALLRDPFALTPGFQGPKQPSGGKPEIDPDLDAWVAPFFMAPINTRNVHRTNALLGHAYGADFSYDEMIIAGKGERGEAVAKSIAGSQGSLGGSRNPQPGEGPSFEEREAGMYDLLFLGIAPDGRQIRATVTGDKDPGYGSTCKMISEAALCLIDEAAETPGGIWTPGAAMGDKLIARLIAHAGLTFTLEG
jgi:short subunit dehydrogenase-like uncharacterized protein